MCAKIIHVFPRSMNGSGFRSSQIFHKKISTHCLTVLTISVILHIEQKEQQLYIEKNGGMTYVNA